MAPAACIACSISFCYFHNVNQAGGTRCPAAKPYGVIFLQILLTSWLTVLGLFVPEPPARKTAPAFKAGPKDRIDPCKVYGRIYIEKNRGFADVRVFVEDAQGFADLRVYKEDVAGFADTDGVWFITDNRGMADYRVFIEPNRGMADFTIFYTPTRGFAGCN